jgi:hypothetical protein
LHLPPDGLAEICWKAFKTLANHSQILRTFESLNSVPDEGETMQHRRRQFDHYTKKVEKLVCKKLIMKTCSLTPI